MGSKELLSLHLLCFVCRVFAIQFVSLDQLAAIQITRKAIHDEYVDIFFSNFFNAHQVPVALELCCNPEVDYSFIAMQQVDGLEGRVCLNDSYPFVIKRYLGGRLRLAVSRRRAYTNISDAIDSLVTFEVAASSTLL